MFGLLVLAFSSATVAADKVVADPFQLTARNADEFREQADDLRTQLQPSGRHAALDASGKATIQTELTRLQALYDRHDAGLRTDSIASQAEVVNAAEAINGVLVGNQADRLVCQMVKPVGSNRSQKVCQTSNDRQNRHRESQFAHRDMIKWTPIMDTKGE